MLQSIFKKFSNRSLKKNPNIIMIMIDGLRYDAIDKISFYRELKKEAVFFPYMITYAPYTIGALHAIFSGMYGRKNGINGYYKSYNFDKKGCFTLTQYMKDKGYYTECDLLYEGIIPSQGFDKARSHDEFKDDLIKRHSEILTQINNKQPFFIYFDYTKLHTNLVVNVVKKYGDFDKEYFRNRESNFKRYLGWVEASATYLKTILAKIRELGLWDNSLIIIFTDHGVSVGDKIGEKAYGVYLYEYTLRGFLYIIKEGLPKNLEIIKMIRSVDILPTIMDILDIKEKKGYKKIDGESFLPFLKGKFDNRVAYSETGGLGGPTPSPEIHNVQAVRTNDWKLICNTTNNKKELYYIKEDKEEKNNLIEKKPEVENELWEIMQKIN